MNNKHQLQEQIDNYLLDLLSEEERKAFEQKMEEDKKLRNEVELTRQIMESFRMKGEQSAFKEMQQVSSEEEMRAFISKAEKKYHSRNSLDAGKGYSRFYWGVFTGIAAGILLMIILNIFSHSEQTEVEKLYSEAINNNKLLVENNNRLSDSLQNQKFTYENQQLIIDSLRKANNPNMENSISFQSQLLALLTQQDTQKKGNASTLRFTTQQQEKCDPENFRIEWTPVDKQGDLYLYLFKSRNERAPKYENLNYDLKKGYCSLKNLEKNKLYFFEIKTDSNKVYTFPFITN